MACIVATKYIPLSECKDRYLYRVEARNFNLAVFNEQEKGFVGIRYKWGNRFLDTEFHWDTGEPYGTCNGTEELEELPLDIGFEDREKLFAWLQEAKKKYCGDDENV